MKRSAWWVLLTISVSWIALSGCKDKGTVSTLRAATSAVSDAASPTPSSSSVALTETPLRAHPDFALFVPYDWETRVLAFVGGARKASLACPALDNIRATDEFDRREQTTRIKATCKEENTRAVAFLKACPKVESFEARLSDYDFNNKRFSVDIRQEYRGTVLVPSAGTVVLSDAVAASWPGATAYSSVPASQCNGPVDEVFQAHLGLNLTLPMTENDAKTLRKKIDAILASRNDVSQRLELAVVLEGDAAAVAYPCGMTRESLPRGRVVGWRFVAVVPKQEDRVVFVDWMPVATWDAPSSCDEAKRFFAPPVVDAGKPGKK